MLFGQMHESNPGALGVGCAVVVVAVGGGVLRYTREETYALDLSIYLTSRSIERAQRKGRVYSFDPRDGVPSLFPSLLSPVLSCPVLPFLPSVVRGRLKRKARTSDDYLLTQSI